MIKPSLDYLLRDLCLLELESRVNDNDIISIGRRKKRIKKELLENYSTLDIDGRARDIYLAVLKYKRIGANDREREIIDEYSKSVESWHI